MDETDRKFLALVMELIDKAQNRISTSTTSAEGDFDGSRVIEKFLPAAITHDNSILRAPNFLECLKGCLFKNPNHLLLEFMLETKRRNVSTNNLIMMEPKEKFALVKPNVFLRNSFIVKVTAVSDPGKFYILPYYKLETMNLNCVIPLQKLAPISSLPAEIFPDQMYAVLNSDRKWSRALVGPPSGKFQVGDEPVETLYDCFLLDFGSHEHISQKSIRVLPKQFLALPPFALECTLNVNFSPKTWSIASIVLFKRWTSKGPMKMQVIAQREGVLNVDLLDPLGDDNYVSIRDCLAYLEEPSSFSAPKRFKPKYSKLKLERNPPKEATVIITCSSQPSEMYVQIVDDELQLYQQMKKELQLEFSSTTESVPPVVGHRYAVLNGNEWSRVLIEMWGSDIVAFHVDTGHRQHIYPNLKIHKLPDRYLEIPAQATRCSLHGVFPVSNFHGSVRNGVESFPVDLHLFMAQYEAKPAVAIFIDWQAGEVGYSEGFPFQELTAQVVLYSDGDPHSVNVQVGQTPMALLGDMQIEFPEHFKIRRGLQQHHNRINSSSKSQILDGLQKVFVAPVIEKPTKIAQTQLELARSVKSSGTPATVHSTAASAMKLVPPLSTSIRPTSVKGGTKMNMNQPNILVIKKYKTKFSLPKYAAITITKVTQPWNIYIRIEDEDAPRYLQMLNELELKFRSVTRTSASYCSSLTIGQPYAIHYGTRWQRCLIESSKDRQLTVFYVDTGLRDVIRPTMMFHVLPERFLELPAQSVRCSLHGVEPPRNPDGSSGRFPNKAYSFLLQFNGKPAVAFFNHWKNWKAGQVGRFPSIHELEASAVIYPKDELNSINKLICSSPSTALLVDDFIEHPGHFQIRCNLAAPKSSEPSVIVEKKKSVVVAALPVVPIEPIRSCPNHRVNTDRSNVSATHPDAVVPAKLMYPTVPAVAPLVSSPNQPKKEETFSIPITFVGCASPEAVFFRNQEIAKEFFFVQNALYSHFEAHKDSIEEPINFEVGFFCAVNSDGRWYRAEVTDVGNYPKIGVVLLDKGFSRSVNAAEIRRLPDELAQQPPAVICVSFHGTPPHSEIRWDPNVTQFIIKQLQGAEQIIMDFGKPSQPVTVKSLTVTVHLSNNKVSMAPFNLNEALVAFGSAGTFPIRGIARRGAYKPAWKSAELPKVGETFWAKVTWVNRKGEFFLENVNSQAELKSIHNELNEKYKDSLQTEADTYCTVGDLCIAKYKDSNDWGRGVVKDINKEKAEVFFVDHGTIDVVDIRDIRLDIFFLQKPVQIMRCVLYNLKPVGDDDAQKWNFKHLTAIRTEAVDQTFRVTVKCVESPLIQVEMIYCTSQSRNFNKEFVVKGLAKFVNTPETSSISPSYKHQKRPQPSCSNFPSDERLHSPGHLAGVTRLSSSNSINNPSAAQTQPTARATTYPLASSNPKETFEMGANIGHHQQQHQMSQSHQQQQELMRQLHHHHQQLYHQQQDLHLSPQLEFHVPEGAAGQVQPLPSKQKKNQKNNQRFTHQKRSQERAEKRELEKEGNWILFS